MELSIASGVTEEEIRIEWYLSLILASFSPRWVLLIRSRGLIGSIQGTLGPQ